MAKRWLLLNNFNKEVVLLAIHGILHVHDYLRADVRNNPRERNCGNRTLWKDRDMSSH